MLRSVLAAGKGQEVRFFLFFAQKSVGAGVEEVAAAKEAIRRLGAKLEGVGEAWPCEWVKEHGEGAELVGGRQNRLTGGA